MRSTLNISRESTFLKAIILMFLLNRYLCPPLILPVCSRARCRTQNGI